MENGAAYVSDLVGCDVWDGQRFLGRVSDVQFGAGEAPLLVVKLPVCAARRVAGSCELSTELLVPYAAEFVTKVDLANRRIDMQLPEGLLDVDAPLSEEEKQQQKSEADEVRAAGDPGKEKKSASPAEARSSLMVKLNRILLVPSVIPVERIFSC